MSIMLPPDSQGNNRRHGWRANDLHPDQIPTAVLHRFLDRFDPGPDDDCWLWNGRRHSRGYGIVTGRPPYLAHRLSWVLFNDRPLTDDLTVDHLCFTKPCVNPRHLEPVSLAENFRRARAHYGQRERGEAAAKATCDLCGTVTRNDGVRRHFKRRHGLAA